VAVAKQIHAELIDGRRFADAGNAGYAEPYSLTGLGQKLLQHARSQLPVIRIGAFNEGDGAGEECAVAAGDAGHVLVNGNAVRCCYRAMTSGLVQLLRGATMGRSVPPASRDFAAV